MANSPCVWVAVFLIFRAQTTKCCCKQKLYRYERTAIKHDLVGKVGGTKDQPTDRGIHLTRDFSTLTREKCHGSSRPDTETRILRVTRIVAGRVRKISKSRDSGRVGSGGFQNLAGRVGSGQEIFKISRVGSGRVGSGRVSWPDPTRPARFDPTREKP